MKEHTAVQFPRRDDMWLIHDRDKDLVHMGPVHMDQGHYMLLVLLRYDLVILPL